MTESKIENESHRISKNKEKTVTIIVSISTFFPNTLESHWAESIIGSN